MHRMKKTILPLLLAVLMALSTVVSASAATQSPTPQKVGKVTIAKTKVGYNGKKQKPKITVKDANGKTISSKYYTVTWKNNKKIGKATATVKFKAPYSGTKKLTFKIVKGVQSKLKVRLKGKKTVTVKKAKKKKYIGKIKYSHHHGKITYKSSYKKIKVTKKGKVYLLKGAKKGTYKITFKCSKAKKYKNAKRVITIKVK